MRKGKYFLLFIVLIFVGCTPKSDVILKATPSKAPAKLAILPVNNFTNDIAGGFIFRNVVYRNLKENPKGYEIQDLEKTDKLLNEAGITDGGQLKFLYPIELSEILGVDGLLFIDVNELEFMTYPYYHTRAVKATFYLYNFEKLIWAKPIRVTIKYYGLSSAVKTIDGAISGDSDELNAGVTDAAVDIAIHQGIKFATIAGFDHELAPEMALVSQNLVNVLPHGSVGDFKYVKESEKQLLYLKDMVSKKKPITNRDMNIEEKEKVEVLDEIIPIIN